MGRKKRKEPNDDEEFEYIVSGMDECVDDGGKGEIIEFDNILDALSYFWKQFYPGHIPVRGVLIMDSVHGDERKLQYLTTSDVTEWELEGIFRHSLNIMASKNIVEEFFEEVGQASEDAEDDDEEDE